MKYYLIDVYGGTDPDLIGPYETERFRDQEAQIVRARQYEEDSLFRLDVDPDGKPHVYAYRGDFFDKEE